MASPIPPYEPPPGADPDPRESLRQVHEQLAQQRSEVASLRRRCGWILVWSFLAVLGSCSHGNIMSSDNDVSQLQSDVQQLQSTVDELVTENRQLRQQEQADHHDATKKAAPSAKATP